MTLYDVLGELALGKLLNLSSYRRGKILNIILYLGPCVSNEGSSLECYDRSVHLSTNHSYFMPG